MTTTGRRRGAAVVNCMVCMRVYCMRTTFFADESIVCEWGGVWKRGMFVPCRVHINRSGEKRDGLAAKNLTSFMTQFWNEDFVSGGMWRIYWNRIQCNQFQHEREFTRQTVLPISPTISTHVVKTLMQNTLAGFALCCSHAPSQRNATHAHT